MPSTGRPFPPYACFTSTAISPRTHPSALHVDHQYPLCLIQTRQFQVLLRLVARSIVHRKACKPIARISVSCDAQHDQSNPRAAEVITPVQPRVLSSFRGVRIYLVSSYNGCPGCCNRKGYTTLMGEVSGIDHAILDVSPWRYSFSAHSVRRPLNSPVAKEEYWLESLGREVQVDRPKSDVTPSIRSHDGLARVNSSIDCILSPHQALELSVR